MTEDLAAISAWLAAHAGFCPQVLGERSLCRALERRRLATGLRAPGVYEQQLLARAEEQAALVEELVVPESWFFRDRAVWDTLAAFAHERQGSGSPLLRLLSAPCAAGEEPYSIALTLLDQGLPPESFQIDGLDISAACLDRARRGEYGRHALRGVPTSERQRHFRTTNLATNPASAPETAPTIAWRLDAAVRRCVRFHYGNLVQGSLPLIGTYDVVFCRNLIIYLHDAAVDALMDRLSNLLRPGGLLVVGSAELSRVPDSCFEPLGEGAGSAFRRRPAAPRLVVAPALAPVSAPAAPRMPLLAPLGGRSEPLEHGRRQIRRHPTSARAHLRLAELLLAQEQHREALAHLRRGLYLQPHSREILERLIPLCRALGEVEQSRRFADRLARLAR